VIVRANFHPKLSKTQAAIVERLRAGAVLYCEFRRPVQYDEDRIDATPDETDKRLEAFCGLRAWCCFRLDLPAGERTYVQRNTIELLRDLGVVAVDRLDRGRVFYRLTAEWETPCAN